MTATQVPRQDLDDPSWSSSPAASWAIKKVAVCAYMVPPPRGPSCNRCASISARRPFVTSSYDAPFKLWASPRPSGLQQWLGQKPARSVPCARNSRASAVPTRQGKAATSGFDGYSPDGPRHRVHRRHGCTDGHGLGA
jgi:hypothetical protein